MNVLSFFLNLPIILIITAFIAPTVIENQTFSGRVTWVSDGDTFKMSEHRWAIRIWGIDAAERDTPKGKAARAFVTNLIKGKRLNCDLVVVDKYKRTVATCYLGGKDIAPMILDAGHAEEYCSFSNGYYGYC
ncbi:thermonuclease family protein [Amylibacter sp. IMCC11727]|uniref:thermonuclease family protein n=1 Tax=Amylibacter sp. IMCC11727 TaxID=3039851 RepID=UPI00244E5002|nr:thermonuclease family protein [Amylibacter sp. IMCC11727]WGI22186.1 thermonuclease family protein [Amylibacter sp. IMCC11727]